VEEYGIRHPFDFVVSRERERVEVENTEVFHSEILAVAEKIRQHRWKLGEEILVRQLAAKCRSCGQRANCGQGAR